MRNRETRAGVRRWRQWSEDEGRAAVADHAASGMSLAAFARSRGISTGRLAYWKERVDGTAAPMTFVAVPLPDSRGRAAQLEITSDGTLYVREDLDVEHLARIVDALARRARGC